MSDVRRNDHASARHLAPEQVRRNLFPPRDILHLASNLPLAGIMHLRPNRIQFAGFHPISAHISYSMPRSGESPLACYFFGCLDRGKRELYSCQLWQFPVLGKFNRPFTNA